jgi:hypothetical protein
MRDSASPEDMFEHAYGEMPPWLERQLNAFRAGGGPDGE